MKALHTLLTVTIMACTLLAITSCTRPNAGRNELEITVVNTWQNRLIGDRGKPQEDRFTKTNIKIRDDWNLRSSGLLGPVEIKSD